jgi:hypothetical protein
MTAEEICRAKYPNADLQYHEPVVGADLSHARDQVAWAWLGAR